MRKLLAVLALSLPALAGRAQAGVVGDGRIELRPPVVSVERLEPLELGAPFASPRLPVDRGPAPSCELRGPIRLELPDPGPEDLAVEVREGRLLLRVAADLASARTPVAPRLDCDSRESYFSVRVQCDATESLAVFCESFQAAASVLGSAPEDAQRYVWGGPQIHVGLLWRPRDGVTVEGGPVVYALSPTQRTSVGARIGVRVDF